MRALVSVITPMYNAAEYIAQTIHSVQSSTYDEWEMLIMDDGSTDASLAIANAIADTDHRIHVYSQTNSGVSAARNAAIRLSHGTYILPLDADDLLGRTFIEHAVATIEQSEQIIAVGCEAEFIGARSGRWHLPPFSRRTLAMRNMIPATTLFRRTDYERTGGYIEQEDVYREDWHFYLSLFAHATTDKAFVRLPEVGLLYRVQPHSRRQGAKQHKQDIVRSVNRYHRAFIEAQLGGPLHIHRSWSVLLNALRHVRTFGADTTAIDTFCWENGAINQEQLLAQGRNTLVHAGDTVVKYFAPPTWWRQVLYLFSRSKAYRSYHNAVRLNEGKHLSPLTPEPLGYAEERYLGFISHSAYACKMSPCSHSLQDIVHKHIVLTDEQEKVLYPAVGRFVATLHRQGCLHRDLSPGNILFTMDGTHIQLVDLNRITWRSVTLDVGLQNFERLNLSHTALTSIAEAYADAMHYDRHYCVQYVLTHRWWKHTRG